MVALAAGLIVARRRLFVNSVLFLVSLGEGVQIEAVKRHALAADGELSEVWPGILFKHRPAHAEVFVCFADTDETGWGG